MKIQTEDKAPEYSERLFELLEKSALTYLRAGESFRVNVDGSPAYNACWRFAAKYGIRYDWDPVAGTFVLYPLD